jgi:hypothetical protein
MAYTQADADALRKAIAQGASRVQFQDRSVTYRSLDEMRQILALIENELAGAVGGKRRVRQTVLYPVGVR